jgi:hypothetical protein
MNGVDAAVAVAREHGLHVDEPRVLKDAHNLVVHLAPAPVVARVGQDMTELRPGVRARELAVTLWLVERGLPILPPSDALPPAVFAHDRFEMTFWPLVVNELPSDGVAAGGALRAIDEALRDYRGDAYGFWPLFEMEELIARLGLPPLVEEVRARVERELEYEPVLLHGDAHFRNCYFTASGPLWADLEDACLAPPEWDAACLSNAARLDGGDPEQLRALEQLEIPDEARFRLLVVLRVVVGIVWVAFVRGPHPDTDRRIEWLRRNAL